MVKDNLVKDNLVKDNLGKDNLVKDGFFLIHQKSHNITSEFEK